MMYLPDTDTLNYLLKKREPAVTHLKNVTRRGAGMVLSAFVHFEVTRYLKLKGAAKLLREYRTMTADWDFAILAEDGWDLAADLWALRHSQGRPIEDADLLIAATARQVGAVLVTNNVSHYDLLGVTLENWAVNGS